MVPISLRSELGSPLLLVRLVVPYLFLILSISSTTKVQSYTPLGCYLDNPNRLGGEWLRYSHPMSAEICDQLATAKGYRFFSLQFANACFGTNDEILLKAGGPLNTCTMICSGNSSQTCGGWWANQAFLSSVLPSSWSLLKTGCDELTKLKALATYRRGIKHVFSFPTGEQYETRLYCLKIAVRRPMTMTVTGQSGADGVVMHVYHRFKNSTILMYPGGNYHIGAFVPLDNLKLDKGVVMVRVSHLVKSNLVWPESAPLTLELI